MLERQAKRQRRTARRAAESQQQSTSRPHISAAHHLSPLSGHLWLPLLRCCSTWAWKPSRSSREMLVRETLSSSLVSYGFHGTSLLSVSWWPQDAFKPSIFTSDAPQITDFPSCLEGKPGRENVGVHVPEAAHSSPKTRFATAMADIAFGQPA
ncbi:hypothetical protein Krac_1070 [Ktedonobacter racemifer DSM 44963]|uniref:Uncharacterized protein n=1 Tax=Ktedonobacter racemifer DSM 44963 TaxID=485913 RepID=D6U656_KTERA|nr:hypothetical protein Krac_1070 [Ktedonobacter racemifer DSM 44963]